MVRGEKDYPHLKRNAILETATSDNSSHIPIFNDTPEIDPDMKPFVASYKYMPANMGENKQSSYEAVTSYRLVDSFDTMKNVALGMYANRVITHDLIRMKVDRKDFHYVTPPSTISRIEAGGGTTNEGFIFKRFGKTQLMHLFHGMVASVQTMLIF